MIKTALKFAKISSQLMLLKTSLHNPVLLRQLEILINKQLLSQDQTYPSLDNLEGQVINVHFQGIGIEWHLNVIQRQVLINPGLCLNCAATIKISVSKLCSFTQPAEKAVTLDGNFATLLQLNTLYKTAKLDLYPGLVSLFGAQAATLLSDLGQDASNQIALLKQKINGLSF